MVSLRNARVAAWLWGWVPWIGPRSNMGLTMSQRKAVTKANAARYRRSDRAGKKLLLDGLCELTGWHRDHAREALRSALTPRWCARVSPVNRCMARKWLRRWGFAGLLWAPRLGSG